VTRFVRLGFACTGRERALRDEGTSYHYLPPAAYSHLDPALRAMVSAHWDHGSVPLHIGASWTTNAPFRETEAMTAQSRAEGILAVEMEAAALYAALVAQAVPDHLFCSRDEPDGTDRRGF